MPPLKNDNFWKCALRDTILNFFILSKSPTPFRYIHFFNTLSHVVNLKNCDAIINISIEDRAHFWAYPLKRKLFGHKTLQTDRFSHRPHFMKKKKMIWIIWRNRSCIQAFFNFSVYHNIADTNHDEFWFFTLLKRCSETIKNLLKRPNYIAV